MSAPRESLVCRRRGCGTRLVVDVVGSLGMVSESCPKCARNARGLCRDCPAPTKTPRSMRCRPCAAKAARDAQRRHDERRWSDPQKRTLMLLRLRVSRARPEVRERRRQDAIVYRQRHPYDVHERIYRRELARQHRADPAFRAKEAAKKRHWRRARRIEREIADLTPIVTDMLHRCAA